MPGSDVRNGVAVAAFAASEDVPTAIEFANRLGLDEQKKKDVLNMAAEGLWNMRLYSQAAAVLNASLPDTSESKHIVAQIQLFSNLKPYKIPTLSPSDPQAPVERLMRATMTNSLTKDVLSQTLSPNGIGADDDLNSVAKATAMLTGIFATISRQTGLPPVVMQDLLLGTMKIITVPSSEPGSRLFVQMIGSPAFGFFVLNENGSAKIAAAAGDTAGAGNEALYLVRHQHEAEAKSLLDWRRGLAQKEQGDDPLGGLLFARLWTAGKSSGQTAIELAAASLITEEPVLLDLLPKVIAARKEAMTDEQRDNLDLLLAKVYLCEHDGENSGVIAQELLTRQPESAMAVVLAGRAYSLTKNWIAWKALVDSKLVSHPNDRALLLQSALEAESEGDFSRARRAYRSILDSSHAVDNDYNTYAWLSLFEPAVDDRALDAAQQANLMSKNSSYADLHTLACLDAALGKTAEARQVLLEAMESGHMEEPDSAVWYAFGRVYEQYGITDAAVAAYKRVEKPGDGEDPANVFLLAQARLKALHAD